MIIGINGKINAGKDTVGEIIQKLCLTNTNQNYKIKKFADKLKDIVCILIGCTREQLEDREFKEKELGEEWWYYCNSLFFDGETKMVSYSEANDTIKDNTSWYIVKLTPRKLLQLLGTEAGRNIIHPNIWVNTLFADYSAQSNWIITDIRFPNELKAVKDKKGITIRVTRPGTAIGSHPSETALDDAKFDYEIINDGTMEELVKKVREILIKEKLI